MQVLMLGYSLTHWLLVGVILAASAAGIWLASRAAKRK